MYGGGRGRGRTATTLPATIQTSFKIPRLFRAISLVFNKSRSNLANLPILRSQGTPWAHCCAFISSVLCAKVISYPDLTLGRRLARKYNDSYRHVYEIFITGGPVVEGKGGGGRGAGVLLPFMPVALKTDIPHP